jgi:hypothetical protein
MIKDNVGNDGTGVIEAIKDVGDSGIVKDREKVNFAEISEKCLQQIDGIDTLIVCLNTLVDELKMPKGIDNDTQYGVFFIVEQAIDCCIDQVSKLRNIVQDPFTETDDAGIHLKAEKGGNGEVLVDRGSLYLKCECDLNILQRTFAGLKIAASALGLETPSGWILNEFSSKGKKYHDGLKKILDDGEDE